MIPESPRSFYNKKEEEDPNQLDIDFGGEIIEGERNQIINELKRVDPNFNPENLILKNDEWRVLRLGEYCSVPEWINAKKDDISYHSKDGENKGRYG